MTTRTRAQRKTDALRRLAHEPSVWIATGSEKGLPHLIPLTFAWDGAQVLVATPTDSPTVRNATASARARASLGDTEDVVIVDASVEVVDVATAPPDLLDRYVELAGWDPKNEEGNWSLLILTPKRVLSWNSLAEIQGRIIMREGVWLD